MSTRMRNTSGQARSRKAHKKLSAPALTKDEKGGLHLRHRVSPETGLYRGRKVLDIESKALKKQAKIRKSEGGEKSEDK